MAIDSLAGDYSRSGMQARDFGVPSRRRRQPPDGTPKPAEGAPTAESEPTTPGNHPVHPLHPVKKNLVFRLLHVLRILLASRPI